MNKKIKDRIDILNGYIKKVTSLEDVANFVEGMLPLFSSLDSYYTVSHEYGVELYIHPKTTEEIEPVLEYLQANGFNITKKLVIGGANIINWRMGGINLFAYFNSNDTGSCKFVKVGIREEPVYELKCSDETSA